MLLRVGAVRGQWVPLIPHQENKIKKKSKNPALTIIKFKQNTSLVISFSWHCQGCCWDTAREEEPQPALQPPASAWFANLNILVFPHFFQSHGCWFLLVHPLRNKHRWEPGEHGQPHRLQYKIGKSHLLTKCEFLAVSVPSFPSRAGGFS